jgi:hypothetical protein
MIVLPICGVPDSPRCKVEITLRAGAIELSEINRCAVGRSDLVAAAMTCICIFNQESRLEKKFL